MPEHQDLTDPKLHEPKGVSSASYGMVYIADGAGSGTWTLWPLGKGFYQHSGTAQVFSTTASKMLINGSGALTREEELPLEIRGTGHLWDTTNSKMLPVRIGDGYDIRVDLPVTATSGTPTIMTCSFDIGGGATPSTVILTRDVAVAKTPPFTVSFGMPLDTLSSATVTNGIQLFFATDSGTATVTNPSILIKKDIDGEL